MKRGLFSVGMALLCLLLTTESVISQTSGMIYQPALGNGKAVLDPNGDGYTSNTALGFSTNDDSESEIPYVGIPTINNEPNSDLGPGPDCGFTDMVDNGPDKPAVLTYLDANNNLLFRFRLGSTAPNSKGYSILIDTDGRFGNSGSEADPNYTSGNPGFEIEIVLRTNFGVTLNDVDGSSSPTQKAEMPYDSFAQKSIAYPTICGSADYFYDFYIPFSVVTTYFDSITTSTPLRMVANTLMNPGSATNGNISDLNGVDDSEYGYNYELVWTQTITGIIPTSTIDGSTSGFPPVRSTAPVVSSPLLTGATNVSGTSTEADGTKIYIYKNSSLIDSATVISNSWDTTLAVALVFGDTISAYAKPTNKSLSVESNRVVAGGTCTEDIIVSESCHSAKGLEITVDSGYIDATIFNIYNSSHVNLNTIYPADDWVYDNGSGTVAPQHVYACNGSVTNCNSGSGCTPTLSGGYYITAKEAGKCESVPAIFICYGTTTSRIISITTNTITTNTTQISGSISSGTSSGNAKIHIFKNGYFYADTTITLVTSVAANWTKSNLSFTIGDVITARYILTAAGNCFSPETASKNVTGTTAAPIITSTGLKTSSITIYGSSEEAEGTLITVYKINGSTTTLGTTTVNAYGGWILTGVTGLVAGESIYATAETSGKTVSGNSNTVIVSGVTSITPTITNTYQEGDGQVTGAIPSSGSSVTITLYIDDEAIGDTTLSFGVTSWQISNLSTSTTTNFNYLYAGGVLTATATISGQGESAESSEVVVSCKLPLTNKAVAILEPEICAQNTWQMVVYGSEAGVVYQLRDSDNTVNLSASVLGTGDSIILTTYPLTGSQRILVKALKISATTCETLLDNGDSVTVRPLPNAGLDVDADATSHIICPGSSTNVTIANSQNGFEYQLRNNADDSEIGSVVMGTGGTISLATGNLTSTTTFNIMAIDPTYSLRCSTELTEIITITDKEPDAGSDIALCGNGSITLAANDAAPGTGNWSKVSGTATLGTTSEPAMLLSGISGVVVMVWTIDYGNGSCPAQSDTVVIESADCNEAVYSVAAARNVDTYNNSDVLATVTDGDGSITSSSVHIGPMPSWMSLANNGTITVNNAEALVSENGSTYPLTILTTDNTGGTTYSDIVITLIPDSEVVYSLTSKAIGSLNLNDTLYYISDANGSVTSATLASGLLPLWASLNTTTGVITVISSMLDLSSYSFTINTTDNTGGLSTFTHNNAPLPVELVNFSAKLREDHVLLQWTTASEKNNEGFAIEKSADGKNFTNIGWVSGAINSTSTKHYSFIDQQLPSPTAFYRLRQQDLDGKTAFSNIVKVDYNNGEVRVEIYPNPTTTGFVNISLSGFPATETVQVQVKDGLGRKIKDISHRPGSTGAILTLSTKDMAPGIYLIKITSPGHEVVKKMVAE